MKSSSRRHGTSAAPEQSAPAAETPDLQPRGNAVASDEALAAPAAEQEESVLAAFAGGGSLVDRLRDQVGDALADAISEHLSEEELLGYVQPAIDDLIETIRGAAEGGDHGLTEAQLQTALADLDSKLTAAAEHLLGRLDVDGFLSELALDHPLAFGAAVLAAAVAWALTTNPDLPAISKTKDLGDGHSVSATLDLSELLDLTVQHVEAAWTYKGESTDANVRAWGGENDGGWGVEGGLTRRFEDGTLDASGRVFRAEDGTEADARLAWDGEKTDAELKGRRERDGSWTADGSLSHDGEKTDAALKGHYASDGTWTADGNLAYDGEKTDAALKGHYASDGTWTADGSLVRDGKETDASLKAHADGGPDGTNWDVTGRVDHDGKATDAWLEGRLAEKDGEREGHLAGRVEHVDGEHTRWAEGRANLDGTWDAELGLSRDSELRDWSLTASADRNAEGQVDADLAARWKATHEHMTSEAAFDASTDGSLSANGRLAGRDEDNPWSLDARVARTADDPELDWNITGKYARTLDKDAGLVLSGEQSMGRDSARSRLALDYDPNSATSASIWAERTWDGTDSLYGIGGAYKGEVAGADAYAKGHYRSDGTWEAAAGISKGNEDDSMSWFAEGHTGRNQFGEQDNGVRAGFRMRF